MLKSAVICSHCVADSDLFFDVATLVISDTLLGRQHHGVTGLYNSAAVEGYAETLCSTLDNSNYCLVSLSLLISRTATLICPVSEMTYTVSSGTLNPSMSYCTIPSNDLHPFPTLPGKCDFWRKQMSILTAGVSLKLYLDQIHGSAV